ncbi:MAG: hypothetical protein GYA18_10670 [Chloroflexi bacterium]|nr:hypothetical protein [Chloroflexota bacterium]
MNTFPASNQNANKLIPDRAKLEIIVETFEDVLAAAQGGATQLDLKAHYPCSGVSPSAGIIARVLDALDIPVMVMVRPHARSFIMSAEDIQTACEEVKQARHIGARNFLLGFLNSNSDLDVDGLQRIKEAAGDCDLHAHLAWELTRDPMKSLQQLIGLGFVSLRASGKTASSGAFGGSVAQAASTILEYKKLAAGKIAIFLAGGLNEDNIEQIIAETQIANIHCGRSARTPATAESPVDPYKVAILRSKQLNAVKEFISRS